MSIPQCTISEFPDTLCQCNDSIKDSDSGNTSEILDCGNVVNMPYCINASLYMHVSQFELWRRVSNVLGPPLMVISC